LGLRLVERLFTSLGLVAFLDCHGCDGQARGLDGARVWLFGCAMGSPGMFHCKPRRIIVCGSGWICRAVPLSSSGVYLPPRSSSAEWGTGDGWVDAFEQLVADIRVFEQRGVVCLVGDFNAHTSTTDDTGIDSQQLLDAMGVPAGDPAILPMRIPARVNPDAAAVCAFGKLLLNLCTTTGLCLAEWSTMGRRGPPQAPLTESHPACRFTYKRAYEQQVGTSVIDYCLVSRSLTTAVSHFSVGSFVDRVSDHAPLFCTVQVPPYRDPVCVATPAASAVQLINYDPRKQAEYTSALLSPECVAQRASVVHQLQLGTPFAEVCDAWCKVVWDVAARVFGVRQLGVGWQTEGVLKPGSSTVRESGLHCVLRLSRVTHMLPRVPGVLSTRLSGWLSANAHHG